jgi:ATP synthase protein I
MTPPQNPDAPAPGGDPWAAFGYIVAGVLFYGGIGWGLSLWLHAVYLIPIGILVGVGFAMYLIFTRYLFHAPADGDIVPKAPSVRTGSDSTISGSTTHESAARETRPKRDDRGETA